MGRRLRIITLWILFILIVPVAQARADVALPVWGELIENVRYLNIQIRDEEVMLHQRVEMKLKKLLTDDYIFTFTTSSTNGFFDESALLITTPAGGMKDSIFRHGCRLEYLSQIALEETLQVAFEYKYRFPSRQIGEIAYQGSRSMSGYAALAGPREYIDIRCNRPIEVKTRYHPSSEWTTFRKGIRVVVQPNEYWGQLRICLPTPGKTDTLQEEAVFEVVPELRRHIPNLIKDEFITIELRDTLEGLYHYHLSGTIELDLETANLFAPFYAWFPNQETNAFVVMKGKWAYPGQDSSYWWDLTDTLEVTPSVYEGQKGFYLLIPPLNSWGRWGHPIYGYQKATLFVEIDDIHVGNSSDFFLVSAPQELSSVEFRIPERFGFGPCSSPFEYEAAYFDKGSHVTMFYGKCLSTGVAHVSWGTVPFPEDYFVLYQNTPNPFNQETVIRYCLPKDCAVKLSVYNLLGQRVRTLVDEVQRADDYQVSWDGKNELGQDVASGVYLCKLDTRWQTDRKKMVIIR